MTIQMTLKLPDGLVRRAQQWARHTHREVEDIIAQAATLSLPPLEEEVSDMGALSDAQILALTHLQMDPTEDERLSLLLERQQATVLTPKDCAELDGLMANYEIGLLRKAEALAEAVRRGLHQPLHS